MDTRFKPKYPKLGKTTTRRVPKCLPIIELCEALESSNNGVEYLYRVIQGINDSY